MTIAIPGPRRAAAPARVLLLLLAAAAAAGGCGKKGPPLAPLLRQPAAPQEVTARRTGGAVGVQFRVPVANADGVRPADVRRVEVYGFTGEAPTPAEVLKQGTLVAAIPVREPPEEDEGETPAAAGGTPAEEPARLPASMENGFDQGDLVAVTETIGPAQMTTVKTRRSATRRTPTVVEDPWQPRLQPAAVRSASRLYFAVGVNRKGHRGPMSPPLAVPLAEPPSAPTGLKTTYDEQGITLSWTPPSDVPRAIQDPPQEGMLASTPRGLRGRSGGYNLYEAAEAAGTRRGQPAETAVVPGGLPKPLNATPLQEPAFTSPGVEFGRERCFLVRAVAQDGAQMAESGPSAVACVTPADTFPPAPPKGLGAVGSEGAISLIWEAGTELDLAGYVVLRAEAGRSPVAITPEPIKETTFRDATAARGVRYAYTVVAVDGAGNRSAPSAIAEETAR